MYVQSESMQIYCALYTVKYAIISLIITPPQNILEWMNAEFNLVGVEEVYTNVLTKNMVKTSIII